MIPIDDLRKIIILEKLPDEKLKKIIPAINVLKLREQEPIFNEGSEARKFYMLRRGKVLLEKRISDKITVSLGAVKSGFSFGWSSIFGQSYSVMAVCAEMSEIFMVNADTLMELMNTDHTMGFLIMQSFNRMMKNRLDRMEEKFLKAIREHPDIRSLMD